MQYPKISIVTPAFNSGMLLLETMQSILGQQYPNLEYIVIDGGSTDGSTRIIEQHSSQLAFWQSQKDGGQYDAINQGLAKATGEILCWLNADDMLLPRSLFVVAQIFTELKEVEWISSLQPASWDARGYLAKIDRLPGFSRQAFLDGLYLPTTAKKGFWMQQESTFWRRSLWEKIGGRIPDQHLAGDFALWCEFYKHARLYGVSYPLGGFRMLEGQRSEAYQSYMTEARAALEKIRKGLHWNRAQTNPWIFSKITDIPKLGPLLKNHFGYEGHFIQNTNPRSLQSSWEIVHQRFLPSE